jgi:hypothetical protein
MKINIYLYEPMPVCEAKICGCSNNKKIVYGFTEPVHSLCFDKNQLVLSQIQACKNLLKQTIDTLELHLVEMEIEELSALY